MPEPWVGMSFSDRRLVYLLQTGLPHQVKYREAPTFELMLSDMAALNFRGAPGIMAVGTAALVVELKSQTLTDRNTLDDCIAIYWQLHDQIRVVRKTAVNLQNGLDRLSLLVKSAASRNWSPSELVEALFIEVERMWQEEIDACQRIAEFGAPYMTSGVATICNTSNLGTPGRGTAFACITEAWERGFLRHVFVAETGPLCQGLRLTGPQLHKLGIPYTLVGDSAIPLLFKLGKAQVFVAGFDRVVVADGRVCNKIGTYSGALAASENGKRVIFAGPTSSFDFSTPAGQPIEIEERNPNEIRRRGGNLMTLPDAPCFTPAFDITENHLWDVMVTERGAVERDDFPNFVAGLRKERESVPAAAD